MRAPLAFVALLVPLAAAASDLLPLAGEWQFALDRADAGIAEHWYSRELPDRIRLPGILQAQGYGDLISPGTPWVETLGDAWWQLQPTALRERFSQPGRTEVPFLAQPPRHYLGAAWYERSFLVPAALDGRFFELELERPHWETRVWVDGREAGVQRSLGAPHTHDLGLLRAGRHRIAVRVDNRFLLHDPAGDGHMPDAHSVSDALGAAWNGIVGRIELLARPVVALSAADVYPNARDSSALLRISVSNRGDEPASAGVTAGGAAGTLRVPAHGSARIELRVRLPGAQPWDEFHPALQRLRVQISSTSGADSREITFGVREIAASGHDLLLNGRPINLRMTHFGGDFPLTGAPATDVATWRQLIAICRRYGLNGMRFHSWCPPEAAFQAADEAGFYLQPECSLWAPLSPGNVYARFLEDETAALLRAYGNHPSFLLLSPSNEPAGHYTEVTPDWARRWHGRDDRRLYAAGTGWSNPAQVTGGAQYAALVRYNGGELRNQTGWFGRDYRTAAVAATIPVLAHEVGQWCAYPDFGVMGSFTGYLQPGNYDIFRYLAREHGVAGDDRAFAQASGRFQLACYKEDIEANLRTPGLAGYQLLDLHDYLGQGTALIGVLDAFWQSKGYATAETFRRFNGETVALARLGRRTFTTAETLEAPAELYHFGAEPLRSAQPYWEIRDASGARRAGGRWGVRDFPRGKNLPLGRVVFPLRTLPAPGAYRLIVGVRGQTENDWPFWVYPDEPAAPVPAGVRLVHRWSDAEPALAAGEKVLFCPGAGDLDPERCPPMKATPVFWNIQMTVRPPRNPTPRFDAMLGLLCSPEHPALREFPTGEECDWHWTELVDGVRSVNLERAPRRLRPVVAAIDDWNRDWRLGVIFECTVGKGRLLVSAIDLDAPGAGPGLRQLRRSLLDYLAGPNLAPAAALSAAELRPLWKSAGAPAPARRRADDPDLDTGGS